MKILADVRLLWRGGCSGVIEYTQQILRHVIAQAPPDLSFQFFYNGWKKLPLHKVLPINYGGSTSIDVFDWHCPNKIFDSLRLPIDRLIKTDLVYSPHINILRIASTPRILTIHDLSFIHYPHFFSYKHRFWHWLQSCKKQAQRATLIVATSNYTKKDIVETLQVPPEKVKVIYQGITPNLTTSQIVRFEVETLRPFLLCLGTIEPRKNFELIIRSFDLLKTRSEFKDFKLVLAGAWGWLSQNVKKAHEQSPHKQDIIILGTINEAEKAALYKSAECFIYPSFFEGFGRPPLEAQVYGCPVVASNRSSIPEILGQSAIFIDPWKITDTANSIEVCIKNKNELAGAGSENVKRFAWKKAADELLSIFKQLA